MQITIPYNYQPRNYQLEYLASQKRFKIVVWHRRSGKSKTLLNEQIRKTQLPKLAGKTFYYFLPTYKQAKQVIFDGLLQEHLPREIVSKINETELAIYYKNGSIQRFAGCEDKDKHRGINPIDVVFDEYSEEDEGIWTEIIQPVLRENKGTASFGFTPKGRNHSWQLLQKAKENPNWFWSVKPASETQTIDEAELEAARQEMPQALYNQEFECEFLEDAGAYFRRVLENVWHGELDLTHTFQLGVDLAKYQDWTVITPFDLNTFRVGQQERFNQVDWNLQKSRIEAVSRRHNNARIIVDSTGVGDPIAEDLDRLGLNVLPYKFTQTSRRQLLDNLAILLEQDKIKIPDDEGLITELESMQLEISANGKIIANVPEGMTDDRIMSLALAVWEATNPIKPSTQEFTLYTQNYG